MSPPTGARAQQLVFISRRRENANPFRGDRREAATCSTPSATQPQSQLRQIGCLCIPEVKPVACPGTRLTGRQQGQDTGLSAGGTPARAATGPSGQALPLPAYLNFPEPSTVCKLSSYNFENQGKW